MTSIRSFKMGKGVTQEKGKKWTKKYLEFEIELPATVTEQTLQESLLRAEMLLDGWLGEMKAEPLTIPDLDISAIEMLPWRNKQKEIAGPNEWAWLLGPKSTRGTHVGAEKLASALLKTEDQTLVLGDKRYSLGTDQLFINRTPLKKESAK